MNRKNIYVVNETEAERNQKFFGPLAHTVKKLTRAKKIEQLYGVKPMKSREPK